VGVIAMPLLGPLSPPLGQVSFPVGLLALPLGLFVGGSLAALVTRWLAAPANRKGRLAICSALTGAGLVLLIALVTSMGMLTDTGAIIVVLLATGFFFTAAMLIWRKAPRREVTA
jgi:hypothetical protein